MDILGGSKVLGLFRRAGNAMGRATRNSFFFRKWNISLNVEGSRLARSRGKCSAFWVQALAGSSIGNWLYQYWGRLLGGSFKGIGLMFGGFFLLSAMNFAVAGRYGMAAALAVAFLLAVAVLWAKGTPADWLEHSRLGRLALKKGYSLPRATPARSVAIYLLICGLAGGLAVWKCGLVLGGAITVALAAAPAIFALPPLWALCLLCLALPLAPTAVCWAMSILIVVSYFFGRAFRGIEAMDWDWVDVLFLIFPILCLFSTLFSFQRANSLVVFVMWMGLFVCVFAVKRILRSKKELFAGLGALIIGATLSGFYGIFQFLFGEADITWTDANLFTDLELRVYSTFENPNVYGEFLLLMIPLVTALVFYLRKPLWKWILLAVDGLLLVNLLVTYSRGCYVGIALTALVFLWQYSKKWLVAVLMVGLPVGLAVMPASVMNRLLSIGNQNDSSTSYRMKIYIGTMAMLTDYWFGGVGIGELAFNSIYPIYALSEVTAFHPHSLFFEMAVSFGVIGLVYILLLMGSYHWEMNRHTLKMDRRDRLLMLGFGSLMAGFALQSVFDYTWYNYRVFQLFWIVLAMGFATVRILRKGERENA